MRALSKVTKSSLCQTSEGEVRGRGLAFTLHTVFPEVCQRRHATAGSASGQVRLYRQIPSCGISWIKIPALVLLHRVILGTSFYFFGSSRFNSKPSLYRIFSLTEFLFSLVSWLFVAYSFVLAGWRSTPGPCILGKHAAAGKKELYAEPFKCHIWLFEG